MKSVKYPLIIFASAFSFLLLALTFACQSDLDTSHRVAEALEAQIEGDDVRAKALTKDLAACQKGKSPLDPVQEQLFSKYSDSSKEEKEALEFLSGTKTSYYCKNVGLVRMEAQHSNGDWSRVSLLSGTRGMYSGSYTMMKDGQWQFLLESTYRKKGVISDVWLKDSSDRHLELHEKAPHGGGRTFVNFDKAGKTTNSGYSTSGDVKEPIPMYLAVDYPYTWGEHDGGYPLVFKKGYKDKTSSIENNMTNTTQYIIKGERTVIENLPKYSYTANGKIYNYTDCWKVVTELKAKVRKDK